METWIEILYKDGRIWQKQQILESENEDLILDPSRLCCFLPGHLLRRRRRRWMRMCSVSSPISQLYRLLYVFFQSSSQLWMCSSSSSTSSTTTTILRMCPVSSPFLITLQYLYRSRFSPPSPCGCGK